MAISAVILDMDGLMVDSEAGYKRAWQQAAVECGYPFDDDFYFTLIGQTNPSNQRAILQQFGAAFPMQKFQALWVEHWRRSVEADGIPLKPGLIELLSFLEERAILTAIATSTDDNFARTTLRAAGIEGMFSRIVTGDQVARSKPAPDIYLEAVRRLALTAKYCLALEDSDAGVIAATSAGIVTIMVPDLKPPSPEAQAAAFAVVPSLFEATRTIRKLLAE